jgi:hypothetical protein
MIRRLVEGFNRGVDGLRTSRLLGPVLGRHLTAVSYTGRRSGRAFRTPVGYRRDGDVVTILVMFADAKKWWRNFTGEGGPLTLELPEGERTGHAVAKRTGANQVTVTVRL